MTLKIDSQEDEQRQLAVTIEVDPKRVRKAMQKAAKKHARSLRIPGFRPGKAPFNVVVGYVGVESIQQDALSDMLPAVFSEALVELEVEPYAQPSLDDVDFEPMVLKMTVPLEPVVVLGDYREMRRDIEPVEISDEAVDEALDTLVQQQATTDPVERAAELGDEVVISGTGSVPPAADADASDDSEEGESADGIFFDEEHFHVRMESGGLFDGTSFVDELVGLSAEESKSFTITFPEDFADDESLAGKTATFEIKVEEVLTRTVPELDDAFAADQPGDAETLEALRLETADRLQKQAEEQFKNDLLDESIDDMLENVEEMLYPPGAVSAETDEMIRGLQQQMQQIGIDWQMYLNMRGETNESLREELEDDAVSRLERRLIFQHFVESEKIELQKEDVDALIEERLANYDEEMQEIMRPFLEGEGGAQLRNEAMMDKVHERLVAILSGNAPDLAELEASDEEAEAEAEAVEEPVAEESAVEESAEVDAPVTEEETSADTEEEA